MCDCDRALELLSLELDGALTPEEGRTLTAHLNGCEACRRTAEELRQLHTILPELEEEVPAGLHQAIMDRVGAEKVIPFSGGRRKGQIRQWASLAAVFAVILLGAGALKSVQSGVVPADVPSMVSAGAEVAPREAADAIPGAEAAQESGMSGDGETALRLNPPESLQPVADGADSQEKIGQAVPFGAVQAEAAPNGASGPEGADAETLRANCAAWLAESAFDQRDRVDTSLMTVTPVTEGDLAAAICDDGSTELLDDADWVVTLGDTAGHDFAILLCDRETLAVLGYVPIA
ncbi:anti-sigma factor [Intestinimonas sp.]|uniref:anti-sigma factor family protein n=1 Tax=Intestinimonas sp. TaxID=1965293 RepID=UPI002631E316|nr:anti-sigma factor [Intestinimonas sp.]